MKKNVKSVRVNWKKKYLDAEVKHDKDIKEIIAWVEKHSDAWSSLCKRILADSKRFMWGNLILFLALIIAWVTILLSMSNSGKIMGELNFANAEIDVLNDDLSFCREYVSILEEELRVGDNNAPFFVWGEEDLVVGFDCVVE